MKAYLSIVKKVLEEGVVKKNRTEVPCLSLAGVLFEHDLSEGFPLLTTKKMPFRGIASELEFFIKGLTDKKWLQDRNNHIWDEWANPQKAPYGHDEVSQSKMRAERDLGPIYGFQWRHFGARYLGCEQDYTGQGRDQLKDILETLKKDPHNRRLLLSAWNPLALAEMALPPCHYAFQLIVTGDKLNLLWNQRSVDTLLGLPFNIASYALLLHLLAKEVGLKEGRLVGFLGDVHIYENHLAGAKQQLSREPLKLPRLETKNFRSIFEWSFEDTVVVGYESHPKIVFEIAV